MDFDITQLIEICGVLLALAAAVIGLRKGSARQIQSAIIEGQSAGAGATLAFGEDSKTIKNLQSLKSSVDARICAMIKEIEEAKEMSVDADQLEIAGVEKGYSLPGAIPMGDN